MKIAVIGAGAMGGASVEGLIKSGLCPADISVYDPSPAVSSRFGNSGVQLAVDSRSAVRNADIVMVFVKPWLVEQVLGEIKAVLDYHSQTLAVVAAGVSGHQLQAWLQRADEGLPPLFLLIPNTAIAELSSMTFITPVHANEGQTAALVDLFCRVGRTKVVEERLLAAGTTLASCGIAYAMRYVRAASEGGVEIGFRADDAKEIVLQTMKGAVELLQANGNHPEAEIDKVTTPGGVTIRGLNEMEHAGFTSAVIRGLKAGLSSK